MHRFDPTPDPSESSNKQSQGSLNTPIEPTPSSYPVDNPPPTYSQIPSTPTNLGQQPPAYIPGSNTSARPGNYYAQNSVSQVPLTPDPRPPQAPPKRRGRLLGIPLILLLVGALAGWLLGRGTTINSLAVNPLNNQSTIEQVAAKFHTSVVQINVQTEQGGALGSGVIIDPKGYIVTNNHVISGGRTLQVVLYDNTKLPAEITGTDPTDDLAVIKINPPEHMSVARIGNSARLQVGQQVLAIGNPLGITQTVTSGIVSALGRNISEGTGNMIPNAIQTDAPINPGNSGGALVDMRANLIGIPTLVPIDPEFKTPANGVGFAIPSNRVKFIVPQIINSGRVTNSGRADMGVQVIDNDPTIASQLQLGVDNGALIVGVFPDSPASQAGLRRGDVIVQINQQPVEDIATLQDILISKSPNDTITVQIYRGNRQMSTRVHLGELQIR